MCVCGGGWVGVGVEGKREICVRRTVCVCVCVCVCAHVCVGGCEPGEK